MHFRRHLAKKRTLNRDFYNFRTGNCMGTQPAGGFQLKLCELSLDFRECLNCYDERKFLVYFDYENVNSFCLPLYFNNSG